jgi:excisionase family DNA binding protein
MDEMYLTPEQVAEKLQIPLKSVMNYLRSGKLPGAKFGKHWRIKASDLDACFQQGSGDSPARRRG